jgi:hypothetical protein
LEQEKWPAATNPSPTPTLALEVWPTTATIRTMFVPKRVGLGFSG